MVFCISAAAFVSCGNKQEPPPAAVKDELVRYPEKKDMYLLTDRPPQLETPLKIFKEDFTPNEYFFVRWHMSQILTKIDIDSFRLYISGAVGKPLAISMADLKNKYPADTIAALCICAGNSRSTFTPRVPGSQWRSGGMGNAVWKGVKLKYLLEAAGIKKNAIDISFCGMDRAPLPETPVFTKSLSVSHAMDGDVLVAYEMNGQPIPMLNGYPLKLVVPGWYATYWIGALNDIRVLADTFHGFWMDKAYQVPADGSFNESKDSLAKKTVPITKINLHSIFVSPEPTDVVPVSKPCIVEGLAFDDGTGIKKVELSFDEGKTWTEARLNPVLGKYAWRRWKFDWTPTKKGAYKIQVKATDINGRSEVNTQWNRSGYARGFIEHLDLNVN